MGTWAVLASEVPCSPSIHQCLGPCVLCHWGASQCHMSQRLMALLFLLLMAKADTTHLEISVPASQINADRAS